MAWNTKKLLWFLMAGALALGAAFFLFSRYRRHPLTIVGSVIVRDTDPRKELPISDVVVSVANDLAAKPVNSDSSGFFSLRLFKHVGRGKPITISFRHPGYEPLDMRDVASDKLYLAHMVPLHPRREPEARGPATVIGNVLVRYTFKTLRSIDVGSAVKTFEVTNIANVPCNHGTVCSPDGRWKANIGSVELDAGPGNEFHDARLSCIAGPCAFTSVEADSFSKGGQKITASVRNWADTTTFLAEAEVTHFMVSQVEHRSYPVIFGPSLNFTLPADAQGVTLEADYGGQAIIFPLGPDLVLSWANCTGSVNKDQSKIYRCELKPGYKFQQ
ncbi:MAG TPA: hypothetical protein VKV39_08600 [Candidatus Sulfotelmatobacter sp.]|nr:hypothetical protein [Candidatus Sulfotelmatobacter sp.]